MNHLIDILRNYDRNLSISDSDVEDDLRAVQNAVYEILEYLIIKEKIKIDTGEDND